MLIQSLTHTPIYVWAILAFLLWRGVVELRDREIAARRIVVLPLVMLVLSLQDIWSKFGFDAHFLGAWLLGGAVTGLLAWKFSRSRVAAGTAPGRVLVRGSVVPLVVMLAIFATKYVTSVALAVQPSLAGQLAPVICAVYGLFNGWFLGRLLRDIAAVNRSAGGSSHTLPARRA